MRGHLPSFPTEHYAIKSSIFSPSGDPFIAPIVDRPFKKIAQMGIEYELRPAEPDEFPARGELDSAIKTLPYFVKESEFGFQFRTESRTDVWPDATVVVESDHIYVCNHLGEEQVFYQILGRLIALLVGILPHEQIRVTRL